MKDEKRYSGGIGFVGALTIAFIVLKLCGVISWPWVWVISPIWIDVLLTLTLLFVVFLRILWCEHEKPKKGREQDGE